MLVEIVFKVVVNNLVVIIVWINLNVCYKLVEMFVVKVLVDCVVGDIFVVFKSFYIVGSCCGC